MMKNKVYNTSQDIVLQAKRKILKIKEKKKKN